MLCPAVSSVRLRVRVLIWFEFCERLQRFIHPAFAFAVVKLSQRVPGA